MSFARIGQQNGLYLTLTKLPSKPTCGNRIRTARYAAKQILLTSKRAGLVDSLFVGNRADMS